jgi:hypothetical protein
LLTLLYFTADEGFYKNDYPDEENGSDDDVIMYDNDDGDGGDGDGGYGRAYY